jgi:acyl dehydratase
MGVADVSENGFALGYEDVKVPHPVFNGDTLYEESEVLEIRESASRPTQGIVHIESRGYNQDGVLVLSLRRTIMVWRKASAPSGGLFPDVEPAR